MNNKIIIQRWIIETATCQPELRTEIQLCYYVTSLTVNYWTLKIYMGGMIVDFVIW